MLALCPFRGFRKEITDTIAASAVVVSNLAPPGLLKQFKADEFTPMATIMRCFSELADLENVSNENWVEGGKNGEAVEGNLEELIYHPAPARPSSASYQNDEGAKAWLSVYEDRNKKFAMTDWEQEGSS